MPLTRKKNAKRPAPPQRSGREPRRQSKRKKGARSARKAKKGATPDILQPLMLTGILIISSIFISIGVLGIKQRRVQQDDNAPMPAVMLPAAAILETAAPETPPGRDNPPAKGAEKVPPSPAPEQPQEKQPPAAPAPQTTEKVPVKEPQSRQREKAPAAKAAVEKAPVAKTPAPVPKQTPVARTPASVPAAVPEPSPKPDYQGTLVFIIDDAGNNLQELEPFLRFPGPLTVAVLPGLPHSAEAARRIRAAGKEVFLHQPMEAVGGQAPGPGAIYAGMSAAEIVALLRQNIAEIGPVAGMNNHQGSKITTDQQVMETVLAFCHEQGLYFLDSRTTAETAVPAAARNLGIKIGERNIFIDNEQARASMNRYIESGLSLASQKGSAVMIGHAWSPELAPLLADLYQNLIVRGYTFSTASSLIR